MIRRTEIPMILRKEEGRPIRTNYDGHPIPDKLKEIITLW